MVEWVLRSFAIAAYLLMLLAVFNNWRVNEHAYSLLMLLASEGFTLSIIVFARTASVRDASPVCIFAVAYTSSYFLLLEPTGSVRIIPEWAAAAAQAVGLGLTVLAKAKLGRDFGILPAVRGLVSTGPYQLVRHPIYLGYLIGNVGFLLGNASLRNGLVLAALVLIQVLRIFREEAIFRASSKNAAYERYRSNVRYRLLPYIF